ncbi:DUF177 domain-containing protein [Acuticoccus kandeliae]|uniref:DUF177 domain-containing protein n=1 Tax=Acuticoccus kandeliae TaxID=2073160 RepID=UPI000D3E9D4F|nr:DUF177 domain-containing protein [Acuticoccus kandeliae]
MIARFSRPVSLRRMKQEETITIEANAEERAALAEELDLLTLDSLTATMVLRPWRGEGVRVTGTVKGALSQACVVSLEPVPAVVEESFDLRLHPDIQDASTVDVDPDASDPPEPLEGNTIDVGAIALEHFALGIDPYPRAPGAAYEEESAEEEEEEQPSPFAVLAALKNENG